jgi:hypothetical protein
MADISQFKAQMKQGGARSNSFKCIITPPQGLVQGAAAAGSKIEFLAKSASLPAADLAPVQVMYRGRPVNFAGERTFTPWTVTLYNDNDFIVRNAFENWVNETSRAESTNGVLAPSDYQVDMEVYQLDRNDVQLKKYIFRDAFPVNVSDISLSWDQNNQIQEYSVTFEYNFWEAQTLGF